MERIAGGLDTSERVHKMPPTEGKVDVHPTLNALVVSYDVETVLLSEYGEPMAADVKECRKVVKLANLTPGTDTAALARTIVSKVEVIRPDRCPEVEQILDYLKNRAASAKHDEDVLKGPSQALQDQILDLQEPTKMANIVEIDQYLENLYEDLQGKIIGTSLILKLARSPDHLPLLISNEPLILALARVLREEWKKSIELSTNIIFIFFCFSTFSIFHQVLSHHKIGSMCMMVLDYEISRLRTLHDDLMEKKLKHNEGDSSSGTKSRREYEKAKKKYQHLQKKQENLLRVTLYLLLNLGEDTSIEVKMKNRGLIESLCSLLDRSDDDLLIIIITFLKKMSIYMENKDEIAQQNILPRLAKFLSSENDMLVNVTLRLLLNLSFDPKLRQEMVKLALLPQLCDMMKVDAHRLLVLCILYHIGVDRRTRSMFAYTDIIPQLVKMIVSSPGNVVNSELIALGINLATSPRNAHMVCTGPGLKILMKRALKTRDPLLFKMIRNLSMSPEESLKKMFLPFLGDLCKIITTGEADAVTVEVLGILGNLSMDIDFHKLITEMNLLPFVLQQLKDVGIKDDLLLGVIVLCGTASLDSDCSILLVQSGIPDLLITILKVKQDDDEIVLQLVYLFYQMLRHKDTRALLMKDSLVTEYLMELMNDSNHQIQKFCHKALDIIADSDETMAVRIQQERFRWHNYLWLSKVSGQPAFIEEPDEDYFVPNVQHTSDLYDLQSTLESRQLRLDMDFGMTADFLGEDYLMEVPHPSPHYMDMPPSMFPYNPQNAEYSQQYAQLANSAYPESSFLFQRSINAPGSPIQGPHSTTLSSPSRIEMGTRGNRADVTSASTGSGLLGDVISQRAADLEDQGSPLVRHSPTRPSNPPLWVSSPQRPPTITIPHQSHVSPPLVPRPPTRNPNHK